MQVVCPKCNTLNPLTSKFCSECGSSLETAKVVTVKPKTTGEEMGTDKKKEMTAEELKCPRCGHLDRVQKVSALYHSTAHSERFMPPIEPRGVNIPWWIWLLGVAGTGIGIYMLISNLSYGFVDSVNVVCALVPGAIVLLVASMAHALGKDRVTKAMPIWKRAMQRWAQLYYCGRCDGVFIPGESSLMPAEQMQALLHSE